MIYLILGVFSIFIENYLLMCIFFCNFAANFKRTTMEAVIYRTADEKRSARRRLIAIKEAVEEQMRQRMAKMEW